VYAFYRLQADGVRLIQDYSAQNTFTWTPADPGVYTIIARVKDKKSGSYEDQKTFAYTITDSSNPPIGDLTVDVSGSLKVGSNNVITADAEGSPNLMYKFLVHDGQFDWVTIQAFSPKNTCNWIPKHNREYKIMVWVKEANSGSYEKHSIIKKKVKK
jgi:hypothetical protein